MDTLSLAATQAWQITLLIVAVAFVTRIFARQRPHLAYLLWLVVMIKCVTPPIWSSPSSLFTWSQSLVSSEKQTTYEASYLPSDSQVWIPGANAVNVKVQHADHAALMTSIEGPSEASFSSTFSWRSLLVTFWLVGIGAIAIVTLIRWTSCWRRLDRTRRDEFDEYHLALSQLSKRLGLKRRVRLLITTSRVGPAVVGLLRPTVVLPDLILKGRTARDLEPILAHELLHIRRGDLWSGLLQAVSRTLWWFHPLVWWVGRVASREAERCCDEQVIAELGCDPARYARSLLEILELKSALQPIPSVPGVRPVEITSQRLERIMKLGQGCCKRTPWWYWVIMLVAAAATLPGAAFVAAREEPSPRPLPTIGRIHRTPAPQTVDRAVTESAQGEKVAIVYAIGDLVTNLQDDYGCGKDQAEQWLAWQVVPAMNQSRESTPPSPPAIPKVYQDGLIVVASQEDQEKVASILQRFRDYGFGQIVIEVRFATSPNLEVLDALEWNLVPAKAGNSDVFTEGTDSSQVVAFDGSELPHDVSSHNSTISQSISPSIYAVLSDQQTSRLLLKTSQDDVLSNVRYAPKVTLFSGQTASIADTVQRPFVTSLTAVEGEAGKAMQPVITTISEGTIVKLRSYSTDDDRVQLDYDVTFSSIGQVENSTFRVAGVEKPVTIQIPEVRIKRFASSLNMKLGETLVFGGLQHDRAAVESPLYLLLRPCLFIPPEIVEAAKEENAEPMRFGAGVSSDVGVTGEIILEDGNFEMDKPASERAPAENLIYPQVYNVADLVTPAGSDWIEQVSSRSASLLKKLNLLTDMIQCEVAPPSWKLDRRVIESFSTNLTVVVHQSKDVHDAVELYLDRLRQWAELSCSVSERPTHPVP